MKATSKHFNKPMRFVTPARLMQLDASKSTCRILAWAECHADDHGRISFSKADVELGCGAGSTQVNAALARIREAGIIAFERREDRRFDVTFLPLPV